MGEYNNNNNDNNSNVALIVVLARKLQLCQATVMRSGTTNTDGSLYGARNENFLIVTLSIAMT